MKCFINQFFLSLFLLQLCNATEECLNNTTDEIKSFGYLTEERDCDSGPDSIMCTLLRKEIEKAGPDAIEVMFPVGIIKGNERKSVGLFTLIKIDQEWEITYKVIR